jgi:hypothetical protein
LIAAVLAEPHGTDLLTKELKRRPAAAKALIEDMLADRDLGPVVRERCGAHLASKPQKEKTK